MKIANSGSPGLSRLRSLLAALLAVGLATASLWSAAAPAAQPSRGIHNFTTSVIDEAGDNYGQAGGHPFAASTTFSLSTFESEGILSPAGDPKDIEAELPPGFVGDPTAAARCATAELEVGPNPWTTNCPPASQVGYVEVQIGSAPLGWQGDTFTAISTLYDLIPQPGHPAQFGFRAESQPFVLSAKVRSDGDYGLTVASPTTPSVPTPLGARVTFCSYGATYTTGGGGATVAEASCLPADSGSAPLLRNPGACPSAAPPTTLRADTYEEPGAYATITSYAGAPSAPPAIAGGPVSQASPVGSPGVPGGSYVTGCQALTEAWVGKGARPAEPSFRFRPEVTQADTPSGYSVDLHVPQEGLEEAAGLASADLDATTVTLPAGVALSPSAADGLQACSEAQMGLTSENPLHFDLEGPRCPDASKLGTLEIDTPLLEEPLEGSIYLAAQDANPFHSRFAIYLGVDDEKTGIVIKLAGKVVPDPVSGQITATFADNPQLPFEDLRLSFFGGPRASLVNPSTCGGYTTQTQLTPWSALDPEHPTAAETATPGDRFAIDAGPGGGTCSTTPQGRPFAPAMNAGTEGNAAGTHSPFVLRLTHNDGEQEFSSLEASLPPGLTATLAGVPYCPDAAIAAASGRTGAAEQANPACPVASRIGTVSTAAGAGPDPYHVGGDAYLAGPYAGAPLSVAFVTPALAGPFDLGDVVVRAGLYVDPETAQVTVRTDPIPTILDGVPLRIRQVVARIDRPDFTLNPTSCEPMSVPARVVGSSGATASPSNRFQARDCAALGLAPRLALRLKGGTRRARYPRLIATLTQPGGQANLRFVRAVLPRSEFLAQEHIRTVCTRVQFDAGRGGGAGCPKGSVYGHAEAWSPLLGYKLSGPVFLRSNGGERELPDLLAALEGPAWQPIRIDLLGFVDSVHRKGRGGGIRTTFATVPDAPVSRFVLRMGGGPRSLLRNSEDLCRSSAAKRRATVRIVGQDGRRADRFPVVANQCHRKAGRRHRRPRHGHGQRGAPRQDHPGEGRPRPGARSTSLPRR
jgi:hypothetical protein